MGCFKISLSKLIVHLLPRNQSLPKINYVETGSTWNFTTSNNRPLPKYNFKRTDRLEFSTLPLGSVTVLFAVSCTCQLFALTNDALTNEWDTPVSTSKSYERLST